MTFVDLRFGFLVKNFIYGQTFDKNPENLVKFQKDIDSNTKSASWELCQKQSDKDMLAKKGRASFLGERAIGHIDPGARSSQLAIEAICNQFINN